MLDKETLISALRAGLRNERFDRNLIYINMIISDLRGLVYVRNRNDSYSFYYKSPKLKYTIKLSDTTLLYNFLDQLVDAIVIFDNIARQLERNIIIRKNK